MIQEVRLVLGASDETGSTDAEETVDPVKGRAGRNEKTVESISAGRGEVGSDSRIYLYVWLMGDFYRGLASHFATIPLPPANVENKINNNCWEANDDNSSDDPLM